MADILTIFGDYSIGESGLVNRQLPLRLDIACTPKDKLFIISKKYNQVSDYFGGDIKIAFTGQPHKETVIRMGSMYTFVEEPVNMDFMANIVYVCPEGKGFNSLQLTFPMSPYELWAKIGTADFDKYYHTFDLEPYMSLHDFKVTKLQEAKKPGIWRNNSTTLWELITPHNKLIYLMSLQSNSHHINGNVYFMIYFDKALALNTFNAEKQQ